ncbi:MAG: hypothetical protein AW09_000382 [Candidatus Accumulibacter phosphatis]|uniref:Uncharacterized protein n=1 Tax=Candidatus Accumulibacter phosphatis TaxID=327160 RepID=A0A080LZQ6_9PROT|nr:MAG: hypothetical protein AW09_000382 [Candidatus Accumulibacter phosphatis]
MIVAGDHQDTTILCRAGRIGVPENVATAVDTRTLAVPHGEDSLVFGAGKEIELLGSPDGGGCKILIDRRLEDDALGLEMRASFPQRLIESSQRAATVARDKACGIQPGRFVAHALQHRQANEGLRTAQKDASRISRIAAVECGREIAHGILLWWLHVNRNAWVNAHGGNAAPVDLPKENPCYVRKCALMFVLWA